MDHVILILWESEKPQFLRGSDLGKLMAKVRRQLGPGLPRRTYPLDAEHWINLRGEFNENWHGLYYDGPLNRIIQAHD